MNMKTNSLSHIHLIKDEKLSSHAWKGNIDLLNIVLIGITNDIPLHDDDYEMHRMVGTLLSSELREQEKLDILEREYNIPISKEFRKDVRSMCNLSVGIEEKGAEKANVKVILNMHKQGYTLNQIAAVVEVRPEQVEKVLNEAK